MKQGLEGNHNTPSNVIDCEGRYRLDTVGLKFEFLSFVEKINAKLKKTISPLSPILIPTRLGFKSESNILVRVLGDYNIHVGNVTTIKFSILMS